MANFGCAAEKRDAAAAIEFQLHSGVRHFVPVNGKSGASQVSGAGQTDAAAFGEFAEFFFPIGDFDDASNALGKIDGSQTEEICRHGV